MLRILLYPFSLLYGLITRVRNYAYDKALKPAAEFDLPVICVGNLTVGGTGKTPMVEYLIRLLKGEYRVATLSRGYGRKSKGFRLANSGDSAATIGDEPFQFYNKFNQDAVVAVGEERALAIPSILQERDIDVVVLDDAFQHRKVKPSLNILLSDYHRPFYDDVLLPAGRLREQRSGAARADVIVVTKCPLDLSLDEQNKIRERIGRYSSAPVFFAGLTYENFVGYGKSGTIGRDAILVTGIGNSAPIQAYLQNSYEILTHLDFPDHHHYTRADVEKILKETFHHPGAIVVTTEKDMVKMISPDLRPLIERIPIYYIPITVRFLSEGSAFDKLILDHCKKKEI